MSSSGRRIAITGAAGYVAGRLIAALDGDDSIEKILALDVRPLKQHFSPKVAFRQQDILTPMAKPLSGESIDSVVHLAYVLNPGHRRDQARRVNVSGTASLLDSCARAGVRHILYLSSTSVYGPHPDNPPMLAEDSPIRPLEGFQYSEDKALAELLIRDYAVRNPGTSAAILRACPVMGPNADNFIARAFLKPVLVGVKGCDPPMQFLHEDDLVDALRLCLMKQASGLYNLAGDGTIRWSEMVELMGKRLVSLNPIALSALTRLAWHLRLQSDSPPVGINFIRYRWTVSTDKIKRELGFAPRHTSREAWQAFATRMSQSKSA
ncbi:MAG: NAD-dependent epimerase/dehydratase family protein [Chloroflexi bacterium]|nr:NAD-dependent epimerase/dehydratase family protein [Chloroflexota bacterium]